MRAPAAICLLAAFSAIRSDGAESAKLSAPVEAAPEEAASTWSITGSASAYSIPDDKDFVSPVLTADRDHLHFEARYNYESLDTASAWVGWNFSMGEKWVLDFTPMI